ncbi:hypothetical protein CRM75_01460 [Enterococcus faecium]|nr:hypothetical protein CRM75_01460 [Enterococcus faecium]
MVVLTSFLFWILFIIFIGVTVWYTKWTKNKITTFFLSLPTLYFLGKMLNLYHWESSATFEKELIHLGLSILLLIFWLIYILFIK